jgi:hypothetical protein
MQLTSIMFPEEEGGEVHLVVWGGRSLDLGVLKYEI